MFPIVLLIIASIIMAVCNFPGGPTGFATHIRLWTKRKLACRCDKPALKESSINRCGDKRRASQPFHPRQQREQRCCPSQPWQPREQPAESGGR